MISSFRRALSSWIMLAFLGLAVIALVVTGFSADMGGGGGAAAGDELANVEGQSITETELSTMLNRQFSRAREEQPELDMQTFLAGGAFDGVLDQMVTSRALVAFARDQGLVASRRMVDRDIVNIPAFRNFAGQFDQATFQQALRAQNITERELRDEIATSLIQRQLLMPAAATARIPERIAYHYASLLLEQRSGTIGVVPTELMGPGTPPTDEEVAAFYRDNQARYVVPERRTLRYAEFGIDQVAAQAQPTDEEIAAAYQANADRWGARETRTLSQVVLQEEAQARSFMERTRQGASFAQAAQQAGFSPGDIDVGQQSREQFANLSNPAVANAAFEAQQGAIVGPVRSELGWHIVRIENIQRSAARPLAAVRGEIEQELRQQKAQDALAALVNRVEDRIGEGMSFEETARAENLPIRETPPITATGTAPGADWQMPEELRPALRSAFELGVDDDPVVETLVQGERFVLLDVAAVMPSAAPPLQQIADTIRADLVRQRALERARAVAQSILAKVQAGTSLSQAFTEAEMRLPTPQAIDMRRMDISPGGQPVPPPLAMMFSMAQGGVKLLEAPNQAGWFVIQLAQVTPGDAGTQPELVQATRAQFNQLVGNEYTEQFARAAEARVNVRRNDRNIERVRQRLVGTATLD